jgi:hypothetical protein
MCDMAPAGAVRLGGACAFLGTRMIEDCAE